MHRRPAQTKILCRLLPFLAAFVPAASAQSPVNDMKAADHSKEPLVLERVSTKVAFEDSGMSSRETSARLRIQSQAGVQQSGVLNFPYASATSTMEIAYVRVIKPDGRIVDTPGENVLDMPADVTREAPFYSDLKEKQVAVKGLEVGDTLEYQ